MKSKESKKEYLRRILGVTKENPGYAEMDTYIREFNTFMRKLNYKKCKGTPAEKIFVDMHKKGITVSSLVAKSRQREDIIREMSNILKQANEYYDSVLEPKYKKGAWSSCHSISDVLIEMNDRKRINNVTGRYSDLDTLLKKFDKLWNEANGYLSDTISLVFSGAYNNEKAPKFLRINDFPNVINEEIQYFEFHKTKYFDVDESKKDFYYWGVNDNPYKNLYLYYLNAYMKQYYMFDLPNVSIDKFYSLTNFKGIAEMVSSKDSYGLKDIADIYSVMSGRLPEKVYDSMKKKFAKLKFINPDPTTGKYTFSDAILPLATYEYYKKKNHVEEDHGIPFWKFDPLMVYVYAPILRGIIFEEAEKLMAYTKYRKFFLSEYNKLLDKVDDGYQGTFLDMLLESPMRLKYRCMGLDVSNIIEGEF